MEHLTHIRWSQACPHQGVNVRCMGESLLTGVVVWGALLVGGCRSGWGGGAISVGVLSPLPPRARRLEISLSNALPSSLVCSYNHLSVFTITKMSGHYHITKKKHLSRKKESKEYDCVHSKLEEEIKLYIE